MNMWLVNTAPTFGVDFGTASVGTVTVTITRADGTTVVTADPTTNNADGTYSYQLAKANNTKLDLLRLDWNVTATGEVVTLYEEIVGSLLFTIDEARNRQSSGQQTPLSNATNYPDWMIARMRQVITQQFEDKTHRSWISRYCRTELHGDGSRELNLLHGHPRNLDGSVSGGLGRLRDVRSLISVSVDGTPLTLTDLALHGRKIINTTTTWPRSTWTNPYNIIVEYEYGQQPVPLEANEEGLRVCVSNLVKGDISGWAQTFSGEDGSISFPQGGFVYPSQTWEWFKRNPPQRMPVVA